MNKLAILVVSGLLAASTSAVQAGDAAAGKAKSAICAGCHGPDGNSANAMYPKLNGQHAPYLEKSIKAYKSGERGDPTMKAMTAALSDDDIANLAAYFASQP